MSGSVCSWFWGKAPSIFDLSELLQRLGVLEIILSLFCSHLSTSDSRIGVCLSGFVCSWFWRKAPLMVKFRLERVTTTTRRARSRLSRPCFALTSQQMTRHSLGISTILYYSVTHRKKCDKLTAGNANKRRRTFFHETSPTRKAAHPSPGPSHFFVF